jgi:hypothetical protein
MGKTPLFKFGRRIEGILENLRLTGVCEKVKRMLGKSGEAARK